MPDSLLSYFVAESRKKFSFLEEGGYKLGERVSAFYAEMIYEKGASDRVEVFFGDEDLYMTVMIIHGDMAHPLSDWIRALKLENCETLKLEFNCMLLTAKVAIRDALAAYAQDLRTVLELLARSEENEFSKIWQGIAEDKEKRIQQEVATWLSARIPDPAKKSSPDSGTK